MSKIDRDIRNALKDTPTISSNVNQNLAQQYAQENYQRDNHESGETFILPVEHHKKPTLIRRAGAFAACFTAIAVLGGSAAAMCGLFSHTAPSAQLESEEIVPPDDEPVEVSEEVSEEATDAAEEPTEADLPEISYDMSTKEGIFAKMLNTDKFYDSISGKYVTSYCPQILDRADIITYQYDVESGKAYSYCSCLNLTNSLDDVLNGSLPEGMEYGKFTHSEVYCDGNNAYYLNFNEYPGVYALSGKESILTHANPGVFTNSTELINVWLSDFEKWDFEPTSTEYGDAVVISGSTIHHERFDTSTTFSMTVDCATGLIIYYTEYDDEGNLYDYIITHDLKINENAENVPEIDMNDYTEFDENKDYGFRINSSGKTYGYTTSWGISKFYRDKLPDYIAFGDGYINTDEFIETVGDLTLLNDTHQYREPSETEELLYTVNIYTSEGDYIYSVYYYDGYIDQ